jgi:hypothetical protein
MSALATLTIAGIPVRQDEDGRYCLNDFHKAAGSEPRHAPALWLNNQQTQELVNELEKDDIGNPISKIQGRGKQQGTYAIKELVYAYAMWISAKFHIVVIRAYDALVQTNPPIQSLPTFDGNLLINIQNGQIAAVESFPAGTFLIRPRDQESVRKWIMDFIPAQLLSLVIETASTRMQAILRGIK